MSDTSINSYQQQLKTSETVQETEAAVLEKAAFALESAQRAPEDDEVFQEALNYNRLVWTSIQSALDTGNQLPDAVVANLMSLSIFIDKQIGKALFDHDRALLSSIININRNIAAGLRDAARLAAENAPGPGPATPPQGGGGPFTPTEA